MKINPRKTAHVVVNGTSIAIQYHFTKDAIAGETPGEGKVWAVINFIHPETHHFEKLRIAEPEDLLQATEQELHQFLESEVECYIRHCDEKNVDH